MFGAAKDGHRAMAPIFRMRLQCWMDGMEEPQLLVIGIGHHSRRWPATRFMLYPILPGSAAASAWRVDGIFRIALHPNAPLFDLNVNTHVKAFEGSASSAAQCLQ